MGQPYPKVQGRTSNLITEQSPEDQVGVIKPLRSLWPIGPDDRPQTCKNMSYPFFKVKTIANSLDHTETEASPHDCNWLPSSSTGFVYLVSMATLPNERMDPAMLPHELAVDVVYAV